MRAKRGRGLNRPPQIRTRNGLPGLSIPLTPASGKVLKVLPPGKVFVMTGRPAGEMGTEAGGREEKMPDMHEMRYTVRPYEAGYGKTARPEALLNYLQDAAFEHSIRLGFSVFHLFPMGLTWVLSRYHIRIDRYPKAGESVRVLTWYPGSQKPFYLREWEILDDDGEKLLRATSSWLVVNLKTGKPADGDAILKNLPVIGRRAIEDEFKPLPASGRADITRRFSVRLSDTDLNRHVNHVWHILWALESVPEEQISGGMPVRIEAAYKGEILPGQSVIASTEVGPDGTHLHRLALEPGEMEVARLRTMWEKRGEGLKV
jgi:medium-chain acyl-[acyl-carrier-protein] hydrolase